MSASPRWARNELSCAEALSTLTSTSIESKSTFVPTKLPATGVIRPFVGGVDKGVSGSRGSDGKDRPRRRGELHGGAANDHQMIRHAVKDGGGDSVAGHVMRPGYRRRRRNGECMRK